MEPYSEEELDIRSEPIRKAIKAVRTDLKTSRALLWLGILGLIVLLAAFSTGVTLFVKQQDTESGMLSTGLAAAIQENQELRHRIELLELAEARHQATPVPVVVTTATPVPAVVTPTRNTGEYVSAWCASEKPLWLPETGNPSTARISWFSDHTRKVTVTGPEIAFDAFVFFDNEKNDEGLGEAVWSISSDQQQISYLIVCHGSWYELQAIELDGKRIWSKDSQ